MRRTYLNTDKSARGILLTFSALIFTALTAWSQTYTWKGTSGTSWTTAANWTVTNPLSSPQTTSATPSPCGNVIIPTVSTATYPTLTSGVNINRLSFAGNGGLTFGTGGSVSYNLPSAINFNFINLKVSPNIFGINYAVHADTLPSKTYQIKRSASTCAPIYRFEVHPGDHWVNDVINNNDNNIGGQTLIKERSELRAVIEDDISYGETVWISYSLFIEPGDDIFYNNNPDFTCILGQWHQTAGVGSPPFDLSLTGQGNITVRARKNGDIYTDQIASWSITRNAWHHFLIKVNFSLTDDHTSLTIWCDGGTAKVTETALTHGSAPADTTSPGYWKVGIYRTANSEDLSVRYANVEYAFNGANLEGRLNHPLPVD